MANEREGFKPDKTDQGSLLARAVGNFQPRKSDHPLMKEAEAAEKEVEGKEGEERVLAREKPASKVSDDPEVRRKERYGIKPRQQDEEGDDFEEEDDLEEYEDDEWGYDDEEIEDEEVEDEISVNNPAVKMLMEQNKMLMQQLEDFRKEGQKESKKEAELAIGSVEDLFSVEELEAAQTDTGKFLEILTKTVEHMGTRILQSIPVLMEKTYTRRSSYDQTVDSFFAANPQLKGKRKLVAFFANEVAQEMPDADASTMLREAGKRAYRELGLKPPGKRGKVQSGRKEKGTGKRRTRNAAFARSPRGKSSTQPTEDARPEQQKLIDRITGPARGDNR